MHFFVVEPFEELPLPAPRTLLVEPTVKYKFVPSYSKAPSNRVVVKLPFASLACGIVAVPPLTSK